VTLTDSDSAVDRWDLVEPACEIHMDCSSAELAAVASEAVQAPGEYLREAFRDGHADGSYDALDVKAVADREAQQRIRKVVEASYPEHAFDGEEAATTADSSYRWVVDPLDGTNNFAAGYPSFASAVAVCKRGEPLAAAIYEPLVDTLYVAERDGGATYNGEPLSATASLPLDHGTVALVVGLSAVTDPELAESANRLETRLRGHCKRVVTTWAPCVDWGLLARGSIEGLVGFHPDQYEYYAGSLLAAESGIETVDTVAENGRYAAAAEPATTDRLLEILQNV